MNVEAVIAVMRASGASDTEILNVVEAGMSGKVRSLGAERQARYRERKANNVTSDATVTRNSDVTLPSPPCPPSLSPEPLNPPPYNPPQPNLSVERKRSTPSEFFDRFWLAYPKRDGSNPRKPALDAFNRRVAAGAEPEVIIRAAQSYASQQAGKDARYVAQAVTWLNQERWGDHGPTLSVVADNRPPPVRLTREEIDAQARAFGIIP